MNKNMYLLIFDRNIQGKFLKGVSTSLVYSTTLVGQKHSYGVVVDSKRITCNRFFNNI